MTTLELRLPSLSGWRCFFYILNFTKVYKMNIGSGRWQKLKKIKKRSFLSEALNFWIIWPGSSQSSSRQQRTFQKDFFILKGQCFQVSSPQYLVWYGFDFANIFVSKARNVCSLYSTVLYVKMLQNKQNVIFLQQWMFLNYNHFVKNSTVLYYCISRGRGKKTFIYLIIVFCIQGHHSAKNFV